ncbi:MAG: TerB family tellurite resistance protein [Pseudomonadota bacterium]
MSFFTNLKGLLANLTGSMNEDELASSFDPTDRDLCSAALMMHVVMADGVFKDEEEVKLRQVLIQHYGLSETETETLMEQAKAADAQAVDLYGFTSILKRHLDKTERIALVEDLWEMVYADGEVHEFEDNVVWRTAELLAVDAQDRIAMKRRVLARTGSVETN